MQHARIITLVTAALLTSQVSGSVSGGDARSSAAKSSPRACAAAAMPSRQPVTAPFPPRRAFDRWSDRTDLSKLAQRIRGGLLTGHEDMPMFRFDRDDADAMVAYIRSIQGP